MPTRILVGLIGVGLCVGLWLVLREGGGTQTPTPRPVRDLPQTYTTTAENWLRFYDHERPPGTGWVLLPADASHAAGRTSPHRSDEGRDDVVPPHVCGACHEQNHAGWAQTAHALTSQPASPTTVLGSTEGSNRITTSNPSLSFEVTRSGPDLYQSVARQHEGHAYTHRQRIDIAIGSGHHGQSFLYWHGDALYQLPLSYFTPLDRWTTSPGQYIEGTADFARPIPHRCLDCHATWFSPAPNADNRYDRTNFVLGVSCVRCHGPGRKHVDYHRAHPDATQARHIVQPADLERSRTNSVCAQCHSGIGTLRKPAFSFQPGDSLDAYVSLTYEQQSGANEDPHAANQLARLRMSSCFQQDTSLSCATCHNPHQFERGNHEVFVKRCLQCHEPAACGMADRVGEPLREHCIDCHMPLQGDTQTVLHVDGDKVMPQLRDHYIKAWPKAAAQVLRRLGK